MVNFIFYNSQLLAFLKLDCLGLWVCFFNQLLMFASCLQAQII